MAERRRRPLSAISCGKLVDGTGEKPVRDANVTGGGCSLFHVGRGTNMPDEAELVEVNRGLQPNSLGLP